MRRRFASGQPLRIAQPNGARTKGFSGSEFPEDLLPLRRGERASAPTPLGRRDPAGGFEYLVDGAGRRSSDLFARFLLRLLASQSKVRTRSPLLWRVAVTSVPTLMVHKWLESTFPTLDE
jgi:hypothetical protein